MNIINAAAMVSTVWDMPDKIRAAIIEDTNTIDEREYATILACMAIWYRRKHDKTRSYKDTLSYLDKNLGKYVNEFIHDTILLKEVLNEKV
jgi:hypothetical protein